MLLITELRTFARQSGARVAPVLPVHAQPQLGQGYFKFLGFVPFSIPCLAYGEIIAEKIKAKRQRSNIRDLHYLSGIAKRPLNQLAIRALAVLKIWRGREGLPFDRFRQRTIDADYDIDDMMMLLRNDKAPARGNLTSCLGGGFRFLAELIEAEAFIASDSLRERRQEVQIIVDQLSAAI